jgi:Tfp pilus assembly protein PilE
VNHAIAARGKRRPTSVGKREILGRTIRTKGFTILELAMTVIILAVGILFLSAAIASSNRLTSLARERVVADNAIQAYIERMRQYYPDQSSTEMSGFLLDSTTPKDYLPSTNIESNLLKKVESYVCRTTYENGTTWNFKTNTSGITPPSAPVNDDLLALGLPRDLNGDGTTSTSTTTPIATNKIIFIPTLIYIEWLSGSSNVDKNTQKQSLKVYAVFGPQH